MAWVDNQRGCVGNWVIETYSFIGHLLVVDEVNDSNRTQDGTC
jgi:hypothetical protein